MKKYRFTMISAGGNLIGTSDVQMDTNTGKYCELLRDVFGHKIKIDIEIIEAA